MAKAKKRESQMESEELTNGDPVEQPGDEPEQEPPQPNGDEPQAAQMQAQVVDFDAQEAALKAQMAELRKQRKEVNKAAKADGKPAKVVKEKAQRPPKDEANGVTRPSMGVTKEVWDTADMLSKRLGTYVDRSTLTDVLNGKVEIGTIHTQYGRWRKYYGLTETRDQRAERMAQIRAKKLADLQPQQAEAQGEQQEAETQ